MTEPRRLYRSRDDAMVAGVCAGVAEFFQVDATVVRVGFALLLVLGIFTRGISAFLVILAYVVMWFLIPRRPEPPTPSPVRP